MDKETIDGFIRDNYPDLVDDILLADGFEEAFIGVGKSFAGEPSAVYDRGQCLEILAREMTYEEAEECFQFNTEGAYMGPHTPIFAITCTPIK